MLVLSFLSKELIMNKILLLLSCFLLILPATAQDISPSDYQSLEYRMIGPFRASRTVGAVGIPSQPNVFFMGVNNGGVWKTDDYGRTWNPIFDEAPTGSVGDIAVSPTHPNVIYVGSGEGLHRPDLGVGDGIFKSIDGGATWAHIGLADVQQVGRLIVHPTDPDEVFVAGLGHPYGPNTQRGVFRTMDGGKTWKRVLYINQNTGAIQVEFDPQNPQIVYASLWEHREGPWENARFKGPHSGLYKSPDGGDTWIQLKDGFPTAAQGLGRIGIGISPSDPSRIYATVDARENGGVYRSDDAGLSWKLVETDYRIWGRASDFAELKVHPNDPDVVYAGNIAAYRSTDAGETWMCIKGAPGGDDYHRIWINPLKPDIMLFAADQGATITVNGGRTWSSWYNQPTAQIYHVTTGYESPYWVYGGQQESGAIGIKSRGNGGQISFRDWMGIGADEYAYIAPDPLNTDLIYGGRVVCFNKKTGQTQNVAPEAVRSGKYRILRTMPLLFHPADPKQLLFATNVLWKTTTGGQEWEIISPDLSREQPEVPASVGDFRTPAMETMKRRGVIYALAPSPLEVNTIWAGTDDGLVHVTTDEGENWRDVTPPELTAWDKVSQADAGHFDAQTAFIAINAIRKDDMRPHIYRTDDLGKNWTRIVTGLPDNGPVNVVREDPKQAELLFAGTERAVYFSIDNGDHWNPLRQNMPATSIRDLVIKDNDLVVGTHGRSIWILDNIAPLRELAQAKAAGQAYLFQPPPATRVRWNMFSDTPLPPEEPTGQNPPDGAVIDYFLPEYPPGARLEIVNSEEEIIRGFYLKSHNFRSGHEMIEEVDTNSLPHPTYWIKPEQSLGFSPGHNRIIWDLRHEPPRGARKSFSIAAVYGQTPSGPRGPFVQPGTYTVRLNGGGNDFLEKTIEVNMDPRVSISSENLLLQSNYSMRCYKGYYELQYIRDTASLLLDLDFLGDSLKIGQREMYLEFLGNGPPSAPDILYGSIYETPREKETIVGLQRKFLYLMNVIQGADARPSAQAMEGVKRLEQQLQDLLKRWEEMKGN